MAVVPKLYVIVDLAYAGSEARWLQLMQQVAAAAVGKRVMLQVRAKNTDARRFSGLAARARDVVPPETPLVLNGDTGLAKELGYDGAHCPERLIPETPLDEMDFFVTAAAHSPAAVLRAARANATAVVFAPVFSPGSKPGKGVGLDALQDATAASDAPVLALGGITPERTGMCIDAGAVGVAVISGVLGADNPATAIDEYLTAVEHRGA